MWTETGTRARQIGVRLFRELSAELPGYTYHDEHGCLNLFAGDLPRDYQELLPLYDRLDAPYELLDAAAVRARWPELHPPSDVVGLFDPQGGYSEPDKYLPALQQCIEDLGVEIHEQTPVRELVVRQGRVAGVKTDRETLEADAVVSAVHVWSGVLWSDLGIRVPQKNFVHQRYVSRPFPKRLEIPPVNAGLYKGYIRPAAGRRLLLGVETMDRNEVKAPSRDFTMTGVAAPESVRELGVEQFRDFLPAIAEAAWESQHVGLLSFSLDGEPILGPVSELPGLFIAAAFHSGGFSYNTVAGLLLAESVLGRTPSIDIAAFAPDRFSRDAAERYLATTVTQEEMVRRRH